MTSSSVKSGRVLGSDVDLHYLEWGEPSSPPLVLLHGLRGHCHSWDDVSVVLAQRFRVFALDQRGRGESGWAPTGDYDLDAYVRDLDAFCNALGLTSIVLVGHSLGGRIGIEFAARHAHGVRGLVVVDIGPDIQTEGGVRVRKELLEAPAKFASFDEAVEVTRRASPRAAEHVIRRRVRYQTVTLEDGSVTWRYDPQIGTQMQRAQRRAVDLWASWRAIRCPTLIVRGSETDVLHPDTAQQMCASNACGQLVEIPDAGHMVFEDNPQHFNAVVCEWLGSLA